MLKVLIIEKNSELRIEKELKEISQNMEIITVSSYKEGMKCILKYGDKISLALLHDDINDMQNSSIIEVLDVNNIKTILICENIKKFTR